ncbi:MAG TPA: hypothetical protein VK912_07285 [Longimicrobiales bacterium]|nr:hypothetical protein [Longimicrobiales bacterium]
MFPLLLILGAGGVVTGVFVLVKRAERERTAALQAAAVRLGWTWRGEVPSTAIPDLDRFELFTQGRRRTLTNLITSPAGDPRALLFDYAYTTGGGNSQSRHNQTVFYAVSDGMQLPRFSLRPQHFFHSIAKAFGYQDIDLEKRPTFSDMFVLRGDDEAAVRTVFDDAVAEFFESHAGVCAAGVGRELLYWRPDRRASGADVQAFVTEGMELADRFSGPRERTSP